MVFFKSDEQSKLLASTERVDEYNENGKRILIGQSPFEFLTSDVHVNHLYDMIINTDFDVSAAFEHVKESLEDLNGRDGVSDTDIIFLKNLMDNRIVQELVKVCTLNWLWQISFEFEIICTWKADGRLIESA